MKSVKIEATSNSPGDSFNRMMWGVLCYSAANKWWDLSRARVIEVVVSDKPTASSYKVRLTPGGSMSIQDENTQEWTTYAVYQTLRSALYRFPGVAYLSVNILEEF